MKICLFISMVACSLSTARWALADATPLDLKARFTTNVLFSSLPVTEVRKLMMNELSLTIDGEAPSLDLQSARDLANKYYAVPTDQYPVIILQGIQSDMTDAEDDIFVVGGRPLISYNEIVFLIPRVMFKGKPFNYLKRLFLDKSLPVTIGRSKYGYDKLLGDFRMQTSDTLESTQVSYQGVKVADFNANTAAKSSVIDFAKLLSDMVVENYISFPSSWLPGTKAICSRQQIKIVAGSLYPIQAQASVTERFFSAGKNADTLYSFNGTNTSIRMIYDWSLFPPDLNCTGKSAVK